MKLADLVGLRLACGFPESGPDPIPCFGVCGGVAGWKDPVTKLHCSLCQGAGKLPYYCQRYSDAKAAEKAKQERAEQQRADRYREAAKRDGRAA
jgi:hypothetical protein